MLWKQVAAEIGRASQLEFVVRDRTSVSGGSINQAYRVSDGSRFYFVKLNRAEKAAMFEAEAQGLREMGRIAAVKVPKPISWGVAAGQCYLILEWLTLGRGSGDWYQMGKQLALLHREKSPNGFGWQRDNTIGDTPQKNAWMVCWLDFWREQRLGFQLQLAQRRGGHFRRGAELLAALPALLAGHSPEPSLVHGDLWSGNAAFTTAGEPVLLDPATYYGDREVDIAMTELFGGFPASFYEGYQAEWPLAPGYSRRKVLYNLYHILNHFNLFGGSYGNQAEGMIAEILAVV